MHKFELDLIEKVLNKITFSDEDLKQDLELAKGAVRSQKGYFEITSVCREDLESIGYNTKEIGDSTMERLASKLADAYCDNGFWIDLPIIADNLEIPKKE